MKSTKLLTLIKFELQKQLISTFLTYNNCISLFYFQLQHNFKVYENHDIVSRSCEI